MENIKRLIDWGDPVVLDVNSGPGMAHYLLLTGYIEYSDGRREVTIIDPGNGKQTTISFDEISGNKGFNLDGYTYHLSLIHIYRCLPNHQSYISYGGKISFL